ncbi:MAG: hypothetical protein WCO55_05490 [Candidatus Falkowbacteria bacterium]
MFKVESNSKRNGPSKASETTQKESVLESAVEAIKEAGDRRHISQSKDAGGLNYEQDNENTIGRVLEQLKGITDSRAKKEFINKHATEHAHTRKNLHEGKAPYEKINKPIIALKELGETEQQNIESAHKKLQQLLHHDKKSETEQQRRDRERLLRDIATMKDKNVARFKDIAKHFKIDINANK